MSPISDCIMAEQEKSIGRVMCDVNNGKERLNFPVRKTKNKVLQKTILKLYLSINSNLPIFDKGDEIVNFTVGSLDPELCEKYKDFNSCKFLNNHFQNMEKFSDLMYIDDKYAVSIINGFGFNECVVMLIELSDSGYLDILFDFQKYPKQTTILFNEKFIITNGYTLNDEMFSQYLPQPEPKPESPKEIFNCCICFDDFEKVSYKCRTCKEGLVCRGCCRKMKGVKKCPICRS